MDWTRIDKNKIKAGEEEEEEREKKVNIYVYIGSDVAILWPAFDSFIIGHDRSIFVFVSKKENNFHSLSL